MKLLSKNEIEKAKSLERKLEIDEGAKLARKVDDLRKLSAEEEMKQSKFRLASLKETNDQIAAATTERDSLLAEVVKLREEKRILQIPLDAKWSEVKGYEQRLQRLEIEISVKETSLEQRKKDLSVLEEAARVTENEIDLAAQRIAGNLLASERKVQEADAVLDEAKLVRNETDDYVESQKNSLLSREAEVAVRERDVENRELDLEEERRQLAILERQINDKYETLLRTENQLNHGKRK